MNRFLLPLAAAILVAPVALAQLPPVKLTVDPAAEPKPVLKYELLVPGRDKVSGNAAHHYAKAALARPPADREKGPEEEKKVLAWEEADLDKLPADEVKEFLTRYTAAFRELEYGTRCKTCEWVSAPASGPAALDDLVNAIPAYRDLARFLALRLKLELAEKRFDAAALSLRTGLQFAKHLGEGPSLIQMLVGHAVAGVFLAKAEEFMARPGAPSLYWAVSALPRPFIDPRPGLDGEDALNESFIPGLAELRKGVVSAEKALDVAEGALKVFTAASDEPSPLMQFGGRVAIGGYAALNQDDAKKELLARGWEKKTVDAMPAVQAVFLNSFEVYRELADDHRKWFFLPYPEAFEGLPKAAARAKKVQKDRKGDTLVQVFLLVLPAVDKVHQAGARTDRKVAMLRAVEAVRIHADAAGRVPKELADVKKVPVPADPLTGQPFAYSLTADGFTLGSPDSESVPKPLAVTYEVKVRK